MYNVYGVMVNHVDSSRKKEYDKRYYNKNKDKVKSRVKKYYMDIKNRDKIKTRMKKYYENNKEKILQKGYIYRVNNREQICKRMKIYNETNRPDINIKQTKYYERNKDNINYKRRDIYTNHRKQNPVQYKAKDMLRSIKRRKKEYDKRLDIEYIENLISANKFCRFCGVTYLYTVKDPYERAHLPSIDRIFPQSGYILGNIHIMCLNCNYMKHDMDIIDFVLYMSEKNINKKIERFTSN